MLAALCLFMAAQSAQAAYRQPSSTQDRKPDCSKDLSRQYAPELKIYFKEYRLLESELGV